MLTKIEAKPEARFRDPYVYNPNQDADESMTSPPVDEPVKPIFHKPLPSFKYHLGHSLKDADGGDAGLLLKRSRNYPVVNFIRSKYSGAQQSGDASQR